ncbi:MAG: hypothetical protein EOO13_08965 [Chitinophagaceae bacterium]|nr:MAG: hypothetical protein EOO13_08965 [Chitinophagaceae bacterium]
MKRIILLLLMVAFLRNGFAQLGGFIRQVRTADWGAIVTSDEVQGFVGAIPDIIGAANDAGDISPFSAGECSPDFNESSNARMSYQCAPDSDCQDCFSNAKDKMNFYRRQLARLNCIYQNTKNFTTSAVAFGDGASGIHAMTAIAWQRERSKIMASMERLKATYDGRYLEFLQGLKASLMEFDGCENSYGQGDWYQKSGFIYFEMMKERYKRND